MMAERKNTAGSLKRGAHYIDALRLDWRELLLLGIVVMLLLLPFPATMLALKSREWKGMKLDVFKPLPTNATGITLLPSGPGFGPPAADGKHYSVAFSGGGVAQVNVYDSEREAVAAWKEIWLGAAPPGLTVPSAITARSGLHLVRGSVRNPETKKTEGLFVSWINGPYEFWFFGGNRQKLDSMIRASEYIDFPDEPGFATSPRPLYWTLLDKYPLAFALAAEIAALLLIWLLYRLCMSFVDRRPAKGSARVSREELRERLLSLNNPESPFTVDRVGSNHLVCRFKLDEPEHFHRLAAAQAKVLYQLDLYLEPWGSVLALESRGRLKWDMTETEPAAIFHWRALRTLALAGRAAGGTGAGFDAQALRLDSAHSSGSRPEAYRQQIASAVLANGWSWRPILMRPLLPQR